jgi:hypothetical protein
MENKDGSFILSDIGNKNLAAWRASGIVKTLKYYSAEDAAVCAECRERHVAPHRPWPEPTFIEPTSGGRAKDGVKFGRSPKRMSYYAGVSKRIDAHSLNEKTLL